MVIVMMLYSNSLQQKKETICELEDCEFSGCILVTNAGIKWLTDIVAGVKTLTEIRLDGCTNLSDDELSLLLKNIGAQCEVYMRGTSVTYMASPEGRRVTVTGCPIISAVKKTEELKVGHAIVIPHESVEHSFVEFVKTKKPVKRLPFHHETDVEVNDWLMSFTEMSLEHVSRLTIRECHLNM
ncbi:uncharacterized protein [Mytilus edulis]|uniref:uncharacterized protein n=1 Tax=Mytilus edulis TaxID=6550 RepID=UPI0039EEE557